MVTWHPTSHPTLPVLWEEGRNIFVLLKKKEILFLIFLLFTFEVFLKQYDTQFWSIAKKGITTVDLEFLAGHFYLIISFYCG